MLLLHNITLIKGCQHKYCIFIKLLNIYLIFPGCRFYLYIYFDYFFIIARFQDLKRV